MERPDPPRALLVHGLGSSPDAWWRVSEHLESLGWRVSTARLRGHDGGAEADRFSLHEYARDLPVQQWDVVVGHSLGATGAVLAARDAGFARRLVLLDPVLRIAAEDTAAVVADQLDELTLTADRLAAEKPHWDPRDRAAKLAALPHVRPEVIEATFAHSTPWDVRAEAATITVPTLIVRGDPSVYSMIDDETLAGLLDANPLVECVVIDGAGHSPHRDRPEETLRAMAEWLMRP
jgi:pimeloyl-ACP methyl ester carboxylesterase